MLKIYFFILFLLAFTLPACDLLEGEEEGQSDPSQLEETQAKEYLPKNPPPTIEIIFQAKKVESETFVSNVRAGDIVKMQITGKERWPLFSSVQKRTFPSQWKIKDCSFGSTCSEWQQQGDCTALYRDHLGEV